MNASSFQTAVARAKSALSPLGLNEMNLADSQSDARIGGRMSTSLPLLVLLFSKSGVMISGRVRYFDGLSLPSVGKIGQFFKDWTCTSELCSFVAGDYGTREFSQTGSGFTRKSVTDSSATFSLAKAGVTTTVHYQRVEQ